MEDLLDNLVCGPEAHTFKERFLNLNWLADYQSKQQSFHDEEKQEAVEDDELLVTPPKIVTSGWLHCPKSSFFRHGWEPHWVQLVVDPLPMLRIFSHKHAEQPKSIVELGDRGDCRPIRNELTFQVKQHVFMTDSKRARDAWVYAIRKSDLALEKERLQGPLAFSNPVLYRSTTTAPRNFVASSGGMMRSRSEHTHPEDEVDQNRVRFLLPVVAPTPPPPPPPAQKPSSATRRRRSRRSRRR